MRPFRRIRRATAAAPATPVAARAATRWRQHRWRHGRQHRWRHRQHRWRQHRWRHGRRRGRSDSTSAGAPGWPHSDHHDHREQRSGDAGGRCRRDGWAPPHIEWSEPQASVEIPIYPPQLPQIPLPQVELPKVELPVIPLPEIPLPHFEPPQIPERIVIDLPTVPAPPQA
ncbi:hypothetical protein GS640_01440 [Rhodococcus hoagii]|nr:hypothetical protein [Prescottella equi]